MIIHCTKKLLDQLKINPDTVEEDYPLISWHANLITLNRRKTIVLVNNKNRYVVVLYGLKATNFKQLDNHIPQAIRRTFEQEGIPEDIINKYMESAGKMTFTKTKDRKLVSRMNRACEDASYFQEFLQPDTIEQPMIGFRLNQLIVSNGKNDYFYPIDAMFKDLEELVGSPPSPIKALQLKITLQLQHRDIYRKVIVPENFTFAQLHRVIQKALGWQDSHLHEFYILDDKKTTEPKFLHHPAFEGYKPIVQLVCSEEQIYYGYEDIPIKMDDSALVSEYMPARVRYVYDLGDNWVHDIQVEQIIEDYNKRYPTCIVGEGNTPPEDVGGEGGYEYFLEVMADENNEEYEYMKVWADSQGYEEFNLKEVNQRLRSIWLAP